MASPHPPQQLQLGPSLFTLHETLGAGSFGTVYRCTSGSSTSYALKHIDLESATDELDEIQSEITVLSQCSSPFLTAYHSSFTANASLYILMEYMYGGNISSLLSHGSRKTLPERSLGYVMNSLLQALLYLHSTRRIHRDIKPANILVSRSGHVKLSDFGVTVQLTASIQKRKTFVGTPYYMAPEVITQSKYNVSADVWSVGITALELFLGVVPYSDMHPVKALFCIPKNAAPRLAEGVGSEELRGFVERCLVKEAEGRGSVLELLEGDFARNFNPGGEVDGYILELLAAKLKGGEDAVTKDAATKDAATKDGVREDAEEGRAEEAATLHANNRRYTSHPGVARGEAAVAATADKDADWDLFDETTAGVREIAGSEVYRGTLKPALEFVKEKCGGVTAEGATAEGASVGDWFGGKEGGKEGAVADAVRKIKEGLLELDLISGGDSSGLLVERIVELIVASGEEGST